MGRLGQPRAAAVKVMVFLFSGVLEQVAGWGNLAPYIFLAARPNDRAVNLAMFCLVNQHVLRYD